MFEQFIKSQVKSYLEDENKLKEIQSGIINAIHDKVHEITQAEDISDYCVMLAPREIYNATTETKNRGLVIAICKMEGEKVEVFKTIKLSELISEIATDMLEN